MSIKDFKTAYCETCKKDTMHFVSKCRVCGSVFLTRKDFAGKSISRQVAFERNAGLKLVGMPVSRRKARTIINKAQKKERTSFVFRNFK